MIVDRDGVVCEQWEGTEIDVIGIIWWSQVGKDGLSCRKDAWIYAATGELVVGSRGGNGLEGKRRYSRRGRQRGIDI